MFLLRLCSCNPLEFPFQFPRGEAIMYSTSHQAIHLHACARVEQIIYHFEMEDKIGLELHTLDNNA